MQQLARLVLDHMEACGTKVIQGSTPECVTKRDNGRVEVAWSNGVDEFDTALLAVGE